MLDFRQEPQENEGHDGYIWSRRMVMVWIVSLLLVLALAGAGLPIICGGFVGFGG